MKTFYAHMRLATYLSIVALAASPARAGDFTTVRVARGLEQPVYVTAPPGDTSRLFIVEANSGGSPSGPMIAQIKILNLTGPDTSTINETPFLTINGLPQREDQGLFNMVFHPNYADNGVFYVTYAFGEAGGESRVERYQVSADPDIADAASATTVFSFFKPFFNHSGNWLGFSPTDVAQGNYYLYHTTGDGGSNTDPFFLAQDPSVKNGKLLRVDVGADGLADDFPNDSDTNHAIPPDNPYISTPGADPSVWAVGFRNPWRASFDRLTGDLYIGEVGANTADEIEFQPFDSAGGENYGWSRWEGTSLGPHHPGKDYPTSITPPDILPMYEKIHDGDFLAGPDRSVTGGYVYRGPIEELQGQYIFADFLGDYNFGNQTGGAQIFSLQYDGSDPSTFDGTNIVGGQLLNRTAEFAPAEGTIDFISSFGEDAEGNLYIVDMGNLGTPDGLGLGEIYMVTPLLLPNGRVELDSFGQTYTQDFDALGTASTSPGTLLPIGWSTDNAGTINTETTVQFPSASVSTETYNAGADTDRTLATGNTAREAANTIQFWGRLTGTGDVLAVVFQSRIEAWHGNLVTPPDTPGEAAFVISLQFDPEHDGTFTTAHTFNRGNPVTTGLVLQSGPIDRIHVTFFRPLLELPTAIPAGSDFRLTYDAQGVGQTQGYIFGVDDVLFRIVAPGDTDGNGEVNSDDLFNILEAGKYNHPELGPATWHEGDYNGDDLVNSADLFLILAAAKFNAGPYTTGIPSAALATVPEPSTFILATFGLAGLLVSARRRRGATVV